MSKSNNSGFGWLIGIIVAIFIIAIIANNGSKSSSSHKTYETPSNSNSPPTNTTTPYNTTKTNYDAIPLPTTEDNNTLNIKRIRYK